MSEENVEIARQASRAFLDRDLEAWVQYFDPDAELLLPRNLLEGGSYKGQEGVGQALADAYEMWDEFRFKEESVRTTDNQVLLLGRATNVGGRDAPTVEYEAAWLFRFREGKIVYYRPFLSHKEGLEAAGLPE